ncbi:MAG: hypothetical protein KGO21_00575 [Hyphomicrobiales bacterium]|nr:hypothetical protein [Hyphomicrobiales bacterium]
MTVQNAPYIFQITKIKLIGEFSMSQSTYTYYRSALKGVFGPVHENDPQCGYYRMRRGRGGPWMPVAIWREATGSNQNNAISDSGKLVCLVNGVERDPFEVWTWVCRYPVTYETYVAVAERGEAWPEDLPDLKKGRSASGSGSLKVSSPAGDQSGLGFVSASASAIASDLVSGTHSASVNAIGDPRSLARISTAFSSAVASHSAAPSPTSSSSHPTFGHNSVGVSEAEGFMEEIEMLWQSAQEWIEAVPSPSSQAEADKAANYAERFGNLENRAEEARTAEKKPVLDLGRSIDAKWKPVISKASDGKVRMKKVLEPYLIGELKRQKDLGVDGEPPRAGTMGRRIGLRSRMILKITSNEDLHNHYKADPRLWADKSLQEVIAKLAEIDLTAHKAIPGAILIEELTAA